MLIIGNGSALAAAIALDVLMNLRLFRLLTVVPLFRIDWNCHLLMRADSGCPPAGPQKRSPQAEHSGLRASLPVRCQTPLSWTTPISNLPKTSTRAGALSSTALREDTFRNSRA
jgi:hypothetical protein